MIIILLKRKNSLENGANTVEDKGKRQTEVSSLDHQMSHVSSHTL